MVWNGIENGMEWNGNFGMKYGRCQNGMEWNGRFQEWNGRQSSILPFQFHTRFRSLYLQKNTYRCRVVINNIVTEVFNFNTYAYYLSTNVVLRLCTLCKQCTYCIIVSTLQFNCSIDVAVDDLDRFDLFFVFFVLRLKICPVVNFVFSHRHEKSYLLFNRGVASFARWGGAKVFGKMRRLFLTEITNFPTKSR